MRRILPDEATLDKSNLDIEFQRHPVATRTRIKASSTWCSLTKLRRGSAFAGLIFSSNLEGIMKKALLAIGFCLFCSTAAFAQADPTESSPCNLSPSIVYKFKADLNIITGVTSSSMTPADHNGGLFFPNRMWGALVDRQGNICAVFNTGNDPWPGSRDIAVAKAGTANDFSNSALALSTANLYGPTQPGGSLYGLNNSNPFNPEFNRITQSGGDGTGVGRNPGGIITFGGG